ncbi:NAD(P)/FAD-dependent oxidoreductase [Micromonospora sp. NPDC047670]|uniref:NAD(P)/FAD-dependent oxidoreductase n=1 Tax=Micromonospora sp. NPDC047670 TaxID=3364252 RepID=UPI003718F3DD
MAGNTEVVVVGGGYAGVMAANRLMQRDDVTVTLINPRPKFVARLRLHQLVGGSHGAVYDYREVLNDRVRVVVDTVVRIDAAERGVTLTKGGAVGYDYLIYAVGSGDTDRRVPGADEYAYPVSTLEAAQRLRSVLDATPASTPLTVVGAGPTGIETAAELAEQGRRVTLVCGGALGPYLHPRARRTAAKQLAKLRVTVLDGPDSKVTAVTRTAVQLANGRRIPSEVTIWTAGFAVPDLAARSGLRTDGVGRLLTDETLTSVDDERIVAAGDSSAPSDLAYRMSAYAASCLGAAAADTVLNRIAAKQPEPVSVLFSAMCISLGRDVGIYQLARKDDTAMGLYLRGGPGAKLKELSCNFSVKHLTNEAHKPGSHKWIKNHNKRQEQLRIRRGQAVGIR